MTGSGLWAARKAAMDAVVSAYTPGSDPAAAVQLRIDIGIADSDAIVQYIQNNAEVQTTAGAPDSEHTGVIL
jgi:hypothetical protein